MYDDESIFTYPFLNHTSGNLPNFPNLYKRIPYAVFYLPFQKYHK